MLQYFNFSWSRLGGSQRYGVLPRHTHLGFHGSFSGPVSPPKLRRVTQIWRTSSADTPWFPRQLLWFCCTTKLRRVTEIWSTSSADTPWVLRQILWFRRLTEILLFSHGNTGFTRPSFTNYTMHHDYKCRPLPSNFTHSYWNWLKYDTWHHLKSLHWFLETCTHSGCYWTTVLTSSVPFTS